MRRGTRCSAMPFLMSSRLAVTETSKCPAACIFLVEVANELDIIISPASTPVAEKQSFLEFDLWLSKATLEIMVLIFNLFFQDLEVVHVTVNDMTAAIFSFKTLLW